MSEIYISNIAGGILKDLVSMGTGPGQNVPGKTIVFRAHKRGIMSGADIQAALNLAVEQGKLTLTSTGVALTDAGYEGAASEQ